MCVCYNNKTITDIIIILTRRMDHGLLSHTSRGFDRRRRLKRIQNCSLHTHSHTHTYIYSYIPYTNMHTYLHTFTLIHTTHIYARARTHTDTCTLLFRDGPCARRIGPRRLADIRRVWAGTPRASPGTVKPCACRTPRTVRHAQRPGKDAPPPQGRFVHARSSDHEPVHGGRILLLGLSPSPGGRAV